MTLSYPKLGIQNKLKQTEANKNSWNELITYEVNLVLKKIWFNDARCYGVCSMLTLYHLKQGKKGIEER